MTVREEQKILLITKKPFVYQNR